MSTKNKFFRTIILGLFIFVSLFGFVTPALADGPYQPNYGDTTNGQPIIVDGIIGELEWDLEIDYFATLYREIDSVPNTDFPEADVYMRYIEGVLYVLVLSQNGQNVNTQNGQFVIVDQADLFDVSHRDAPPDGTLPDLQWVNLDGTLAEGWEAALVWEDSIDPAATSHRILVHSLIVDGTVQKALTEGYLPIDIYPWDYGDLDDINYGTYETSNGPKHSAGTLRLGQQVDGEIDGQPDDTPILDDLNGRNDEDGVSAIGNWLDGPPTIEYTVNGCLGTCYLNAWVDWGNDTEFNLDTDILFTNLEVTNGTYPYDEFTIPDIAFPSIFNVRFRLCDASGVCDTPWASSPTDAPFGEVEDYQWSFDPNAVTLNSFSATSLQNSTRMYVIAGAFAILGLAGAITLISKRKIQNNNI